MRYYARIDPTGDNHNFLSPQKDSFKIVDVLDGVPEFEFVIQNTAENRAIIADHSTDDFQICRVSDDLVLLTGSIDSNSIEYFSENEASPDRIRLSGFASYIDLGYLLFKRLADADASAAEIVNESFGSASGKYNIGQDETFLAIKIPYTVAGIQNTGTTVVIEYSKGSGVWATLDCLDESRAFTKVACTYYLIIPNKPDDWAKDTVSAKTKYWVRFRISAGSYSTNPTFGTIYTGDSSVLRIQFDNIAADTILGYVLQGSGYTEAAAPDNCPSTLISMRGEYESRLRWIAGIANALTWTDGSDKKSYNFWITSDKKVHFKQQRGSSKGDISADLVMLDNSQDYQGIGNRIFGLGSYDGINQRRAIVENQASQDSYSLREIPFKDLRFSHESSLKELIEKHLTNSKSPLREVSCEVTTEYWLDNSLAVGDEVVVDQPEWAVSAQTFRIQRSVIGPSRTTLDLGAVQVHLENIRDVLQKQINVSDVWMAGASNIYSVQSYENCDVSHPLHLRFFLPPEIKYINHVYLNFKIKQYRAYTGQTPSGGGSTTPAGGGHTTPAGGGSTSGSGGGTTPTSEAAAGTYEYGALVATRITKDCAAIDHKHKINLPYHVDGPDYPIGGRSGGACDPMVLYQSGCAGGAKAVTETETETGEVVSHVTLHDYHQFVNKAHTHDVTIPNHTHSTPAHTHIVSDHAHTTPNHTHQMTYQIYEASESSPSITVKVGEDGGSLAEISGSPFTSDQTKLDITDLVQAVGTDRWIDVEFTPNQIRRIEANAHIQVFIESK